MFKLIIIFRVVITTIIHNNVYNANKIIFWIIIFVNNATRLNQIVLSAIKLIKMNVTNAIRDITYQVIYAKVVRFQLTIATFVQLIII